MENNRVTQKILVLITAQQRALKLIDYGFSLANINRAQLHILHVQKGNSVFDDNDSLKKLQDAVNHGANLGASVHIDCENDVSKYIGEFVKREKITHVVMGESIKEGSKSKYNQKNQILEVLPEEVNVYLFSEEVKAEKEYKIV